MDSTVFATSLLSQVGFGATLGFLLAYGVKKAASVILKILALVSALFMLALAWLASIAVITINYNALTPAISQAALGVFTFASSPVLSIAHMLPLGGGFGLGLFLGAKKG